MATVTETESQTKRKASTAGLSGAPRPVKRRASKACCCCRARKVRCDVVENGSPCTNCRLDQVECVVTESKRRKLVFTARKKKKKIQKRNMDSSNASWEHEADCWPFRHCIRKSRGDTETNINSHQASDSPADTSEDNSVFRKRMLSHDPLSEISAVSPSQASIDLEQGQQHMPHLLCSYSLFITCWSSHLLTDVCRSNASPQDQSR